VRLAFSHAISAPVLLIITALLWGAHWVVARAIYTDFSAFALSFWRWTVSCLVLLPFAWPHLRKDLPRLLAAWKPMLLLGFTGTGIYTGLGYLGIRQTEAINALLIQAMTPAFIPTLAFFLLGQRTGWLGILGLAISCAGMLVIASRLDPQALLALRLNPGDLWLMANVFMWAIYTVCLRWKPTGLHPMSFTFSISLIGVVLLVPLYAWEVSQGGGIQWGLPVVLGILFLGVLVVGYLMWNKAVSEIGAARASPYIYLVPVFGIALAVIFIDEALRLDHGIGVVLILAGVWLAARQRRFAG